MKSWVKCDKDGFVTEWNKYGSVAAGYQAVSASEELIGVLDCVSIEAGVAIMDETRRAELVAEALLSERQNGATVIAVVRLLAQLSIQLHALEKRVTSQQGWTKKRGCDYYQLCRQYYGLGLDLTVFIDAGMIDEAEALAIERDYQKEGEVGAVLDY